MALSTVCACGNEARYTTASGLRTCSLCAMDDFAVKDSDIPALVTAMADVIYGATREARPYEPRYSIDLSSERISSLGLMLGLQCKFRGR